MHAAEATQRRRKVRAEGEERMKEAKKEKMQASKHRKQKSEKLVKNKVKAFHGTSTGGIS